MTCRNHARTAGRIAAAALIAAGAALALAWLFPRSQAAQADYDAEGLNAVEEDGFPVIDWDYWSSVNPDVVGWITIPGTLIDHPIVAAGKQDAGFYLSHDVFGRPNPYGAVFLDASCPLGLDSENAVVLAHHMDDGTMFADVARYSDESFARAHRSVLLQTPEWKRAVNVRAAEVTGGWEPVKQTVFETRARFESYVAERLSACSMKLDDYAQTAPPKRMLMLVSCSYNLCPDNERTIAYAW